MKLSTGGWEKCLSSRDGLGGSYRIAGQSQPVATDLASGGEFEQGSAGRNLGVVEIRCKTDNSPRSVRQLKTQHLWLSPSRSTPTGVGLSTTQHLCCVRFLTTPCGLRRGDREQKRYPIGLADISSAGETVCDCRADCAPTYAALLSTDCIDPHRFSGQLVEGASCAVMVRHESHGQRPWDRQCRVVIGNRQILARVVEPVDAITGICSVRQGLEAVGTTGRNVDRPLAGAVGIERKPFTVGR